MNCTPEDSDSTTSPVRRERRRRPPLLGGDGRKGGGGGLKSDDISYLSDVTKGRSRERIAIIEDGVSA